MKKGDLVRIAKQPPDLLPQVVGEVGFIEEVLEGYASFQGLKTTGDRSGCGSVPLDCLVPETSSGWIEARRLFDERQRRFEEEGRAFTARVRAKEQELADRYGITVEAVNTICSEIRSMYP